MPVEHGSMSFGLTEMVIILAIVPAGRVWGLDRRVIVRRPELRRWPF